MKAGQISRRDFLKASSILGAGLLIGCKSAPPAHDLMRGGKVAGTAADLNAWLHIAPEGDITFMLPAAEMGQGVYTSLPMLVCEELDADLDQMKIRQAPLAEAYIRPGDGPVKWQSTGGSSSVRDWAPVLRKTGATARLQLRKAAAARWNVPLAECKTEPGVVVHSSGKRLAYGEIAEDAAKLEPPVDQEIKLKKHSEFRIIGKDKLRLDTPLKTNGTAEFGIDVKVPGMVYATCQCSPVFGGEVASYDKKAALAMKGVSDVVEIPGGVAVVADSYYRAKMALFSLKIKFKGGDKKFSSEALEKAFRKQLDKSKKKPAPGAKVLEAEYEVPFLAHSTMEPMNCTVDVRDERCDIWVPSQNLTLVGKTAEDVTGLSLDKIKVNQTFLGGGFGRRLETDFVDQALRISMAVKKPVKLVWSREEDTRHDFYRPASMARFQVTLDDSGSIQDWHQVIVSPAIMGDLMPRWNPIGIPWLPYNFIMDDLQMEGAKHTYSAEPQVTFEEHPTPVPIGNWRSVGYSHNGFYVESMMDEAAHAAGEDPAKYLRRHLTANLPDAKDEADKTIARDRYLKVLDLVTEKSDWGKTKKGRFKGIAIHGSFRSVVAHVVELSVKEEGPEQWKVKLHKVTSAVDCGLAVNPLGVRAQVESSVIWSLTAALVGEITLKDGAVQQSNFHDYEILRLAQIPPIEVHIVESNAPSTGMGEPAVPPLAPALTNAIFAATGKRIRSMPLKKHGFIV